MINEKKLLAEMEKLQKERDAKIIAEGGELQYETEEDIKRQKAEMEADFAEHGLLMPEILWAGESDEERARKVAHNIKASVLMAEHLRKKENEGK